MRPGEEYETGTAPGANQSLKGGLKDEHIGRGGGVIASQDYIVLRQNVLFTDPYEDIIQYGTSYNPRDPFRANTHKKQPKKKYKKKKKETRIKNFHEIAAD
ncbi:hypothetical protein DAPPUDRAFT_238480 [Daphnia pulex]|uniref:Uncharacterized protein n=1 Tax=Daphnia pulex TaxID=6669 RepID=E9G6I7_DAPPU|nr:hypothetical protein DAPPUDRAFT_238480 [Daphnia pulex]|eukprot:EFX84985.1 hypothetical protein DAPPUDRAFT_238480 [Daphnia pulex]